MEDLHIVEVQGMHYILRLEATLRSFKWMAGNSERGDETCFKYWYEGTGYILKKNEDPSTKKIFTFTTKEERDSSYPFTFEKVLGFNFDGEKDPDLFTPKTESVKESFIDFLCGDSGILVSADTSKIIPSLKISYDLFAHFSEKVLSVS
ncbi:MAG: hypothetical protein MUD00_03250 [Candidatus Pacebacteria bacterium]|jgi:hypothetical protein|nr:hypothetical protein [Candidatus Paceibacterota bacterium]